MAPQVSFAKGNQLNDELDGYTTSNPKAVLPSQPGLPMASTDRLELNQLAKHTGLWSTPSPTNITLLHNPCITTSENPALHLVQTSLHFYIKPLPAYLLSHAFWTEYLLDSSSSKKKRNIHQAAMGLLRSYCYLIRYEVDFRQARCSELVPFRTTWQQWCKFAATLDTINDYEVSPRYHYGELRL